MFHFNCISALKGKLVADNSGHADLYTPLSPKVSWYIQGSTEPWKPEDDAPPFNLSKIIRQDHFT